MDYMIDKAAALALLFARIESGRQQMLSYARDVAARASQLATERDNIQGAINDAALVLTAGQKAQLAAFCEAGTRLWTLLKTIETQLTAAIAAESVIIGTE